MTGASPALQAPTPPPLPPLGKGAPRGGQLKADALPLSGLCRFLHRLSPWPLHRRALAPPES
ncbi:MAG TPA: hypothetical protein VKV18_08160, partial [Chthonomonas sp.]|uniref:hypothetical protein n=1 Tax=Chthonomonas sp. TaxID=2282153 RepID=UPI002B4B6181